MEQFTSISQYELLFPKEGCFIIFPANQYSYILRYTKDGKPVIISATSENLITILESIRSGDM